MLIEWNHYVILKYAISYKRFSSDSSSGLVGTVSIYLKYFN